MMVDNGITMKTKFIAVLTILIIITSPLASSESNDDFTVNNEDPEMSTGDYFLYELDMSGLLNSMEDEDIDEVLENSNSGMRMEYGGDSCMLTGWEDCSVSLMSWEMNITMVFSSGSGIDNDEAIMLMKMETITVSSGDNSESTDVTTMDMWFSIDGEPYHSETVMTELSITSSEDSTPEIVSAGDTWSEQETVTNTINEKSRMNGDPWENEDEVVENETTTTNWNAESTSNVYIGDTSYQTMKIKSEELGSNESGYVYVAETGMPVKMEYYEDGALQMVATLVDYSWTNDPSQVSENTGDEVEGLLPGFTLLPTLAASVFAGLVLVRSRD